MFSDHNKTSTSIAAVSAPSVACSMLAVQQQKRLCRQFVDGSLFHARGTATEKALSSIRRRVRGTTRLPHDEVRSVDRPGILACFLTYNSLLFWPTLYK